MVTNVIAIYPGRFQPFGMQHKVVYEWAANKFGKDKTFIATSNKSDNIKSPFNFEEKKKIMALLGVQNAVHQVKNTYNAIEITEKFDPKTTAVVYVVGEKDSERLTKGKYFLPYPGPNVPLKPYTENGYFILGPKNKEVIPGYGEMNGTNVRKVLGSKSIPVSEKHKLFKSIFGTYNKPMADLIISKLTSLNEHSLFSKNWWNSIITEVEVSDEKTNKNDRILDFIHYAAKRLKLKKLPNIKSTSSNKYTQNSKSFGHFDPNTNTILVFTGHRAMPDILRTIAHELVHRKQDELGVLTIDSGKTGSKHENQANSIAGILLRDFGKKNPEIFMEGYMSAKLLKKHNAKMDKLKDFLHNNVGREFVYDFNQFPKTVYGVPVEDLQESKILKEGGAGGHVLHPFDLPTTKTGKDLIKVFDDVKTSLKTVPARVKVDGVNTTIKLVKRNGKLQFALDRGSKKEEDIQGVTIDELGNRFPEGHGMLKIGKLVLTAFNQALPKIKGDLMAIGLGDPNILLNLETVLLSDAGTANVIGYDRNFFAIHGLMKSEFIDGKRSIKEIPVNANAIETIVEKASPTMNKFGFDLYGFKKLQPKVKKDINYTNALNSKFTVKYSDTKEVTKTLKAWLNTATNPINDKVTLNSGKTEPVMTKKYYLDILNQTVNLDDLTTDPKEQKKIIDAAVMYHATVLLGDVILQSLTSDVGEVENHEGIMIRDNSISKTPFKITGHFIIKGMASGFRK